MQYKTWRKCIRKARQHLSRLLHVIVVDNFKNTRLQIFKSLYTVTQGKLFEFMLPDD